MLFESLPEYDKDCKRLKKKYKSIESDIEIVKKVLSVHPNSKPPFSYQINNLNIKTCIIKIKKIACKSLKGKGAQSGLRLIYAYFPDENKIIFIELYHKSQKEKEDRDRIKANFC